MNRHFLILGVIVLNFAVMGCGGSSSSGLSGLSLSDIPNTTDAIASATSSNSMVIHNMHALGLPTVVGTPPTMSEVANPSGRRRYVFRHLLLGGYTRHDL